MKKTLRKIIKGFLIFLLAAGCLTACALFALLPPRSLDTEIVYQGF